MPLPSGQTIPLLWRAPFPNDISKQLVSFDNPHGSLTNSDLELAGTVMHHDVLTSKFDVAQRTICTLTDNTPALAWQHKASRTTFGPGAYLLRLQALHRHKHGYCAQHQHIPGPSNQMADDCSRLWKLTDSQLIAHFNSVYP